MDVYGGSANSTSTVKGDDKMRVYEHREINADHDYEVWYVSEDCTKLVSKAKPDYLEWILQGNIPEVIPYIPPAPASAESLRQNRRDQVDSKTDLILNTGMSWMGHMWRADKEHFDDYRDACQQVMTGLETEVLIHGIGENAYVTLTSANVLEFFTLGKAFKLNTMFDGYKLKDLGGTLSDGVTVVKALKDMTINELESWVDPR